MRGVARLDALPLTRVHKRVRKQVITTQGISTPAAGFRRGALARIAGQLVLALVRWPWRFAWRWPGCGIFPLPHLQLAMYLSVESSTWRGYTSPRCL
jgi:hypothetical protein